MINLLIATTNSGKIREFKKLLEDHPIHLRSLEEFDDIPEVEETGKTFVENAELKAVYYAKKTNCWTLADDSGLEVKFLNNEPGVFSARYAGENASDQENISKLLNKLEKVEFTDRSAKFICQMAISDENGNIKFTASGICSGHISTKPSGNGGFGYDPVFIPENFQQTFGNLSPEIKHRISHRSQATRKIIQYLNDFLVF